MTAVWDSGSYSGGALILLLAMADVANDDGSSVFPSLSTLAQKTRMNERSVRRLLRELEKDGAIERVREATNSRPTEYRIGGAFCPPTTTSRGDSLSARGDNLDSQGGLSVRLGGTPESPNSPVKHQLTVSEPGGETPPVHTPDVDEGKKKKAKPPTADQLAFIRSLCRQRDIAVPDVATATEAAELIDDLKAGKAPERPTAGGAPAKPHPSNFGRCGRCKANPVKRNEMGFCAACVDWLAGDSGERLKGETAAA